MTATKVALNGLALEYATALVMYHNLKNDPSAVSSAAYQRLVELQNQMDAMARELADSAVVGAGAD